MESKRTAGRTKNGLGPKVRQGVIEVLRPRLADALDLQSHAKEAHWNVKGPAFIALHELFDKVAASAEEAADLIAERIVTLGGRAEGTSRRVAGATSLKEYPASAAGWAAHVDALTTSMADFAGKCREAIDAASKLGDQVTADVLTEVTREMDKQVWFVESHREE